MLKVPTQVGRFVIRWKYRRCNANTEICRWSRFFPLLAHDSGRAFLARLPDCVCKGCISPIYHLSHVPCTLQCPYYGSVWTTSRDLRYGAVRCGAVPNEHASAPLLLFAAWQQPGQQYCFISSFGFLGPHLTLSVQGNNMFCLPQYQAFTYLTVYIGYLPNCPIQRDLTQQPAQPCRACA